MTAETKTTRRYRLQSQRSSFTTDLPKSYDLAEAQRSQRDYDEVFPDMAPHDLYLITVTQTVSLVSAGRAPLPPHGGTP